MKLYLRHFAHFCYYLTVAIFNEEGLDLCNDHVHVVAVSVVIGFLELD
jgi:hypothetical protein